MPFSSDEERNRYMREWMKRKRAKEKEAKTIAEQIEEMPKTKDEKDTTVKVPEQAPKKVQISQDRVNQLLAEIDRQNRETREEYAKLLINKLEAERKKHE